MEAALATGTAYISNEPAASLIRHFEGLYLKPYYCSAGKLTIGYGHLIRPNEVFKEITEEEAESLLMKDINIARNSVQRLCRVPITFNQEAALISFVFNLGGGAFQAFALRQKLNRGEYNRAADEFPRWVYAGGIKLAGLIRRRAAERALFLAGSPAG